jgi:uncharacterized membrane protein YvlD (DUF360 family)
VLFEPLTLGMEERSGTTLPLTKLTAGMYTDVIDTVVFVIVHSDRKFLGELFISDICFGMRFMLDCEI